jgi:hypothetical protein
VVVSQVNHAADRKQGTAPPTAGSAGPAFGAEKSRQGIGPTKWYAALERPDWWLVIIAALSGAAVAWQAFETRRATEAVREANQATAHSQRARLTIKAEYRDAPRGDASDRSFQLIATNFGKTIAEVIEFATALEFYGHELFRDLETIHFPDPVPNRLGESQFVLPGEQWQFPELHGFQVMKPVWETEIRQGRRIPVWYGWVEYKDFNGKLHRRRFFFMFSGGNQQFFAVGPEGWNAEDR